MHFEKEKQKKAVFMGKCVTNTQKPKKNATAYTWTGIKDDCDAVNRECMIVGDDDDDDSGKSNVYISFLVSSLAHQRNQLIRIASIPLERSELLFENLLFILSYFFVPFPIVLGLALA